MHYTPNVPHADSCPSPTMPHTHTRPNLCPQSNRIAPSTWIMYGLGISQLSGTGSEIEYNGRTLSVEEFMEERFGYHTNMRWW